MLNENLSLSDIAAVTGSNEGINNGAWWILIILFAIFGGFGGNGFGNNNGTQAALTRQDLCMDMNFSDLKDTVNGIRNGIYEGFSSTAVQNMQGQNNIMQSVNQGFADVALTASNNAAAVTQNINTLSQQLATCCCNNRYDALQNANATQNLINNLAYEMATDTCSVNTNASNNTRSIIDAQNASTQAILNKLDAQALEAKNEKIASQAQEIFNLQLQASQAAQNNYIINSLRPSPTPAYVVANPYTGYYGYYGTTVS